MNIEIANRLVELRRKNGLSQEELANLLGVSRQAVSKWERAEASPDTDNLICLAKIYGISLDELLNIQVNKETNDDATIHIEDDEKEIHVEGKVNVNDGEGNQVHIGKDGVHIKSKDHKEVHIDLKGINIKSKDDEDNDANENVKSFYFSPNKKHSAFHSFKCVFDAITPFLCMIAYILMGFLLPEQIGWKRGWIVFLLIPIVPTIFAAIEHHSFCAFCYPIFITGIYLILGMCYQLWHPYWFLFITIPIYYIIFGPIDCAIHRSLFKRRYEKKYNNENDAPYDV